MDKEDPGPNWARDVIILFLAAFGLVGLAHYVFNPKPPDTSVKKYVTFKVVPEHGECGMIIDAERIKRKFQEENITRLVVVDWSYEIKNGCVKFVTIDYHPIPKLTVPIDAPVAKQRMDGKLEKSDNRLK